MTEELEGLVDTSAPSPDPDPAPKQSKTRKPRADKGTKRQAPNPPSGLMTVRFEIEPEDSFALHRWLVEQGYEDAAVALTQQAVKHFDSLRLALEN